MDGSSLKVRAASAVLLGFLWFVVVPFVFVLFYTVIEVQGAAKAGAGADGKSAAFLVRARADRILQIETDVALLSPLVDGFRENLTDVNSQWYTHRDNLVNAITILGSRLALELDNTKCDTNDQIRECYRTAEKASLKALDELENTDHSSPLYLSRRDSITGWRKNMEDALASLNSDNSAIDKFRSQQDWRQKQLLSEISEYKLLLGLPQNASVSIPSPTRTPDKSELSSVTAAYAPAAATPSQDQTSPTPPASQVTVTDTAAGTGVSDHALGAVALSYNQIRVHPFFGLMFEFFFFLPSGVIVAIFTALMGAIGAGVVALLKHLAEPAGDSTAKRLYISYVLLPLLGAMAGFMVFFVISAGASFLIQPGAVNATEAVNSLSPAALASLGVFAGLSAERALKWLNSKAESFFTVADEKGNKPADAAGGAGA